MANGTYTPIQGAGQSPAGRSATFQLISGVELYGSYAGCGAASPHYRNFVLHETVLSGDLLGNDTGDFGNRDDNSYHVLTYSDPDAIDVVLDGFAVSGGHADGSGAPPAITNQGAAVHIRNGSSKCMPGGPTLRNCIFRDNWAAHHAAVNDHSLASVIDRCTFRDNFAGVQGGGLLIHSGAAAVSDCTFVSNRTDGEGGGVWAAHDDDPLCTGPSAPVFTDCTFVDNQAVRGGGLFNIENQPTLVGCLFERNGNATTARGGGIYNDSVDATLTSCVFRQNKASEHLAKGGGIYNDNGSTVDLHDCEFSDANFANYGGSIYGNDSTLTLTACSFLDNTFGAGGIYVDRGVFTSMTGCLFDNNGRAATFGGGELLIKNCTFINNHSGSAGGALLLGGFAVADLSGCRFFGNDANQGGAVYTRSRDTTMVNCLFSGNTAVEGGAFYDAAFPNPFGSNMKLVNCALVQNSADNGNAIAVANGPYAFEVVNSILWNGGDEFWQSGNGTISVSYSNIEGGWPGVSNIAVNPMFVDPDGDDDLPGTEDDNLRLLNWSPSVNVGNNGAVVSTTDADGVTRIVYGVVDMGAYETQEPQGPWPQESPTLAPPPHDILKNRYISIDPRGTNGANVGWFLDIRLILSSTQVNGVTAIGSEWWAQAPDADCIAVVGPTRPVTPPNWDACPTLHLTGCPIIPTSSYDIVMIDDGEVSDPPLSVQTQAKPGVKWYGDAVGFFDVDTNTWTAPQGTVNIDDAVAAIKTFQNPAAFNATHVSVTDVHPNLSGTQINKVVNFDDVFVQILGFQGREYPGTQIELCPDP
ncbi:MAG: right-handed parallel beta-helix repeat-containing protein [Planctomycetes bacterium]|nr:right-handed parallel beta-helix repeat-containing protein [Planctomycetota bacterium]